MATRHYARKSAGSSPSRRKADSKVLSPQSTAQELERLALELTGVQAAMVTAAGILQQRPGLDGQVATVLYRAGINVCVSVIDRLEELKARLEECRS